MTEMKAKPRPFTVAGSANHHTAPLHENENLQLQAKQDNPPRQGLNELHRRLAHPHTNLSIRDQMLIVANRPDPLEDLLSIITDNPEKAFSKENFVSTLLSQNLQRTIAEFPFRANMLQSTLLEIHADEAGNILPKLFSESAKTDLVENIFQSQHPETEPINTEKLKATIRKKIEHEEIKTALNLTSILRSSKTVQKLQDAILLPNPRLPSSEKLPDTLTTFNQFRLSLIDQIKNKPRPPLS